MNGNHCTSGERDTFLKSLAAELTDAAYAVALRHEKPDSWVELELELWKAMGETVQRLVPQRVAQREAAYRDVGRESHRRYASC